MFQEFRKKIKNFKRVGVFSHVRPDGDCIGAQIALSLWLEKNGIQAWAFNDDPVPENLVWLTDFFSVIPPEDELVDMCDAFVVVDGNAPGRFGRFSQIMEDGDRPAFMIDHHPDPESGFEEMICDDTATSTCELIYKLYMEHKASQLSSGVAKALYTGILTDTGSFSFDSVSAETLEIAADLLKRGKFKPSTIVDRIYSNRTVSELRLMSLAMSTIQLFENNQIATIYVTQEMVTSAGAKSEDTEGFVNYALSISGVKAAILFKDMGKGGVKMSLRSRSDVDVNIWAREMNGGGHKKAAGAFYSGSLEKAIEEAVRIGAQQLDQQHEDHHLFL